MLQTRLGCAKISDLCIGWNLFVQTFTAPNYDQILEYGIYDIHQ
jgi:hypothetical protein